MKEFKKELYFYPYYDSYSPARHFEEMEAQGWQLMSPDKSRLFITYRKTEPKEVSYGVTYFADVSAYDSSFNEEQLAFLDLCRAAGWHRVGGMNKMQIFRNEDPQATPLETDPRLTVEVIHDSMKTSLILPGIALGVLAVLQLWLKLDMLGYEAIKLFSDYMSLTSVLLWVFLILHYIAETARYFSWYGKAKKAAEDGILHTVKNGRQQGIVSTLVVTALIIVSVLSVINISPAAAVAVCLYATGVLAIGVYVPLLVKKYGGDNAENKKTGTVIIVIAVTVFFFGFRGIVDKTGISQPDEREPVYIIEDYKGTWDFKVYKDSLPVYIRDFPDMQTDAEYSTEHTVDKTFLVEYHSFTQTPLPDYDADVMIINVVIPANSLLYDICLKSMLNEYEKVNKQFYKDSPYYYQETDSTPWQAEKAWQLRGGNGSKTNRYIAAYPDYYLHIITEMPLTDIQMKTISDKMRLWYSER